MNNAVFDWHDWNAEIYDTPKRISDAYNSFGIAGKTISQINVIGFADKFSPWSLAHAARRIQYESGVPYDVIDDGKFEYEMQTLIPCETCVCEPIVFTFDDGNTFELQSFGGGSLKMSVNQIPSQMKDGTNHSNIEASIIFKDLIGCSFSNLTIRKIQSVNRTTSSNHKEQTSYYKFIFWMHGKVAFSITQRQLLGGWYKFELGNQMHHIHEGLEIMKYPYGEFLKGVRHKHQVLIVEGHDGSSYFWIMPVRQLSTNEEGYDGLEEYSAEEISIEEDDIQNYLHYFLIKYFDTNFEYNCRTHIDRGNEFEWYDRNIYTYESVRRMLSDIREVSIMIQNNPADPALDEFYDDVPQWRLPEYKESAEMIVDFYDRFCRRMESMMKHAPQYNQICFEGP